ncbi:hypothetical protein D3C87_1449640 [compost metagenome]
MLAMMPATFISELPQLGELMAWFRAFTELKRSAYSEFSKRLHLNVSFTFGLVVMGGRTTAGGATTEGVFVPGAVGVPGGVVGLPGTGPLPD